MSLVARLHLVYDANEKNKNPFQIIRVFSLTNENRFIERWQMWRNQHFNFANLCSGEL